MIKHRQTIPKKKMIPLIFILRAHKLFRNRITREIKKAKKEYFKQFFEDNLNNMKKTWQGIKKHINILTLITIPVITLLNFIIKENILILT